MEYRIYCDESVKKGKYFSNFYGGVLVRPKDLRQVEAAIARVCQHHHLNDELKWQRVTSQYLDKYLAVVETFFDLMEADWWLFVPLDAEIDESKYKKGSVPTTSTSQVELSRS